MGEDSKQNQDNSGAGGNLAKIGGSVPSSGDAGKGNTSLTLPEKRGRGRPRKDGSSPAASPVARTKAVDPQLAGVIVSTLIQLIKLGDDLWAKSLINTVNAKLPPDVRPLFLDNLRAAAFSAEDEKILTPVLTAVVMKYDIFARMGPEALALLWLAQYGFRMASVSSAIDKAAAKLAEKPKVDVSKN